MSPPRFQRTRNRRWLGNGFGHAPAEYALLADEVVPLGKLVFLGASWWFEPTDEGRRRGYEVLRRDHYRDLRNAVLAKADLVPG